MKIVRSGIPTIALCIMDRSDKHNLARFVEAQNSSYHTALSEIKNGRKQSHWMWYIFPQVQGLGFSETSKYYAIRDLAEAQAYLSHPVLGPRLSALCHELLQLPGNNANQIFGSPDDQKLHSSMTLFASIQNPDPVFELVLQKFFSGKRDARTLDILNH